MVKCNDTRMYNMTPSKLDPSLNNNWNYITAVAVTNNCHLWTIIKKYEAMSRQRYKL